MLRRPGRRLIEEVLEQANQAAHFESIVAFSYGKDLRSGNDGSSM
jgi:hypothetical protein